MMSVSLYNCGHCKLPQLVGQRCHCRTPEDEAFDELAKKQGMWGGGYQAKRKMAADKQREWVGLTDAEIHGTLGYNETREMYQFALALIAKLKEKNT